MADVGSELAERELAASLAAQASETLRDIDAALRRLHREPERFGVCEETGAEIPFERLDIIPWARTRAPGRRRG